jgi:hypothetical protein
MSSALLGSCAGGRARTLVRAFPSLVRLTWRAICDSELPPLELEDP